MSKSLFVFFSGTAGAGKNTVIDELIKRNKKYWYFDSILKFRKINDIICIIGGINHGKSHSENEKYNNWKF